MAKTVSLHTQCRKYNKILQKIILTTEKHDKKFSEGIFEIITKT